jgi:hypothetical protein
MSFAPALVLRQNDRGRLCELARLPSVPSGLAKRARLAGTQPVLMQADQGSHLPMPRTSRRTQIRPGNPAQLRDRQNHATLPVPVVARQQVRCCVPARYYMNHHSHPRARGSRYES